MQIKYFQTAWNDIKNSPGWFGKLCLLALVNFIPIFGQIVTYGYLYGWAREIAWGTHRPLPASIFANEDGKFWRRGWFLFVISFVFTLIPSIIIGIGSGMQAAGLGTLTYSAHNHAPALAGGSAGLQIAGSLVYLVGFAAALLISIFMWIAYMRTAIYDRLSAGFQFGKVWRMFRHDTSGIFKIFGMNLLVGGIIGTIGGFVIMAVVSIFVVAGVGGAAATGYSAAAAPVVLGTVGLGSLVIIVLAYFVTVGALFVSALVARGMGYWTMQFDVPRWRGQDDPMPFEEAPAAPAAYAAPQAPVPQTIYEPDVYAQPAAQSVAAPADPAQQAPATPPVADAANQEFPTSPEVLAYDQQMAEWQQEAEQAAEKPAEAPVAEAAEPVEAPVAGAAEPVQEAPAQPEAGDPSKDE